MAVPTAVIVIPVHNPKLTENEKKSFAQCLKILPKYPIVFICSESLDITAYQDFAATYPGANVSLMRFDDHFFKSYKGYNTLLVTTGFYGRFKTYDYMLIYQLDAWVFSDELIEWCQKRLQLYGLALVCVSG